jgi:hypothetical protein
MKYTLKDLKTYIDSNAVVVVTLIPPSLKDRSSKQNIIKEILELNHSIDQMDLADVYRIFYPTCTEYTFFSLLHGTLPKLIISESRKQASANIKTRNNPMDSF